MHQIIYFIRVIALQIAVLKGNLPAQELLQPDDFTCIARAAFGEARGEGQEGMALVVGSIVNRHNAKGRSGCAITQRAYDGFRSWKHRSPREADERSWYIAQLVTLQVVMGEYDLGDCADATHFLNPKYVRRMPNWASSANEVCSVGHHVGYHVTNI